MTGLHSFINSFNVIKQIPIFSKLSWFDQQRIARKCILEEFKKGEIIRREGDPADFFYCVVSGRIEAYTLGASGAKDNVEFIHRGMNFGVISVFTGENHSLNFEALNDSVILKIAKDDFHAILKTVPDLAIEFNQSLSKRVRSHVVGKRSVFESTIISIYSPMKGTGSSTYAVNLAVSLQQQTKKNVIFVNIHVNNNQTKDLSGASPVINAFELKDVVGDHVKIFESIQKNNANIHWLNVAFDPEDLGFKRMISPLVSTLVGTYHYVIVDLPNNMDEFVFETLTQSDVVHLMSVDRRKDLEQIREEIDRLALSLKERFKEDRIKVVVRAQHEDSYFTPEEISNVLDFGVYAILPQLKPNEIKQSDQGNGALPACLCEEKSAYGQAIRRVARQIGGVMVGVVLGGGAALGVAHVGVIRVLERENIPVDVIVGSSMGALIGAIWATGRNASELETVAREFENKKNMLKLFDPVFPIQGLIGGRLIRHWLRGHLGDKTFQDTHIPIKIVSYDIVRREEIVINTGTLVEAVRQSIAIPGVIEPVIKGEQVIIDGGVLNPLPTNVLVQMGIKKIIAINVLQSPEETSEGHEILKHKMKQQAAIPFRMGPWHFIAFRIQRMFEKLLNPNISDIIVRTLQASEYVIAEQSAQQADVLIHPDLTGINWFELYKVNDLIQRGEEATVAALPKIKKLMEVDSH